VLELRYMVQLLANVSQTQLLYKIGVFLPYKALREAIGWYKVYRLPLNQHTTSSHFLS